MLITKRVCDMCKQEVEDGARAIFSPSAGANDYDLCPACARKIEVFIRTGSARTANMSFGNTTLPSNTTLAQPTGKPHEGGLDGWTLQRDSEYLSESCKRSIAAAKENCADLLQELGLDGSNPFYLVQKEFGEDVGSKGAAPSD